MNERHRTRILGTFLFSNGAHKHVARCDCGWQGRAMDTKRDADDDADEHVRMMADD
jgi:hypothetical protein